MLDRNTQDDSPPDLPELQSLVGEMDAPDAGRVEWACATCCPPREDSEFLRHDARTLTGGRGQATILLDGKVYTLRITRAGKLILTK